MTVNPVELLPPIFSMTWSFAIIFGVCEFGGQLTQQFGEFDERLCKCKWYLWPIELQRMLIIVISNAQQPSYMLGYGNIVCTRYSFKQVRRGFRNCDNELVIVNKYKMFFRVFRDVWGHPTPHSFQIHFRQFMLHFPITWCYEEWIDKHVFYKKTYKLIIITEMEWTLFGDKQSHISTNCDQISYW